MSHLVILETILKKYTTEAQFLNQSFLKNKSKKLEPSPFAYSSSCCSCSCSCSCSRLASFSSS